MAGTALKRLMAEYKREWGGGAAGAAAAREGPGGLRALLGLPPPPVTGSCRGSGRAGPGRTRARRRSLPLRAPSRPGSASPGLSPSAPLRKPRPRGPFSFLLPAYVFQAEQNAAEEAPVARLCYPKDRAAAGKSV